MGSLLTAVIRDALGADAELREWRDRARQRRLMQVASVRLPNQVCPAAFTAASAAALEPPPNPVWHSGVEDPWPGWLGQNIRHRMAQILAGIFDPLRAGDRVASGLLPASGTRLPVPLELWDAETLTVDLRTSGLLAGGCVLFLDVSLDRAAGPVARARIDAFVRSFDREMHQAGRRFSLVEATEAARAVLGAGVSAAEIEAALDRGSPSALTSRGRRSAAVTPSAAELRAAAVAAAEIRP